MLLPAGMPLKGLSSDQVMHDLRKGGSAAWLGFAVGRGRDVLEVRITEQAWDRLTEYLELAHTKPNASLRAAVGSKYSDERKSLVAEQVAIGGNHSIWRPMVLAASAEKCSLAAPNALPNGLRS